VHQVGFSLLDYIEMHGQQNTTMEIPRNSPCWKIMAHFLKTIWIQPRLF